ncbi:unnamed protein product, partial [Ectocarpus fasciculatus]
RVASAGDSRNALPQVLREGGSPDQRGPLRAPERDPLEDPTRRPRLPRLSAHILRRFERGGRPVPFPRGPGDSRHDRECSGQGPPRHPAAHIADEDRPQHEGAPHHLPDSQDPPADDSVEPHDRPGSGAVLPTAPSDVQPVPWDEQQHGRCHRLQPAF